MYPPLTRAFMTEPLGDELYPSHPVFAEGHKDGVGYWVSVNGKQACEWVTASIASSRPTGRSRSAHTLLLQHEASLEHA